MICPYNHTKIEQVSQDTYEYNKAGWTTFHQNKMIEKRRYAPCKKDDCAVWVDGKCRYGRA